MTTGITSNDRPSTPRLINVLLWVAQAWVGICFIVFGYMKGFLPIPQLAGMWIWPGEYPWLVRIMGAVDFAGGLGILLPSLTRIKPGLGVLAALGCAALQICAMVFHAARGEFAAVPFNLLFLLPSAFVFWGRRKYPITPRG